MRAQFFLEGDVVTAAGRTGRVKCTTADAVAIQFPGEASPVECHPDDLRIVASVADLAEQPAPVPAVYFHGLTEDALARITDPNRR